MRWDQFPPLIFGRNVAQENAPHGCILRPVCLTSAVTWRETKEFRESFLLYIIPWIDMLGPQTDPLLFPFTMPRAYVVFLGLFAALGELFGKS